MIVFHNDHLAPAGFCDLLYEFVPTELHVPVVFTARRGGSGIWLGEVRHHLDKEDPSRYHVHLRLDHIYASVMQRPRASSISAALWHKLLHVALHEFGHIATSPQLDQAIFTLAAYNARDPQGHGRVEKLAHEWADLQIDRLLNFDPRLAQPRGHLTGYFGARHAQIMRRLSRSHHELISEIRCAQTRGQLTAGHVLCRLGVVPTQISWRGFGVVLRYKTGDYAALRALGPDLGIPYTDAAGRRHYLYTWGDLRELKRRYVPPAFPQTHLPPLPAPAPAIPAPLAAPQPSQAGIEPEF